MNGEQMQYYQVILTPILDNVNNVVAINGIDHDFTQYKEKEETIRKMVYRNVLTDLPNSHTLLNYIE